MNAPSILLALAALLPQQAAKTDTTPLRQALTAAEGALGAGDLAKARDSVQRALERDRRSVEAWKLRARCAEAADDRDELVYALHQVYRLSVAQKVPETELAPLREKLLGLDPVAKDLLGLSTLFRDKLAKIAERYEKEGRLHAAIGVHKKILALDPENAASQAAIERIAATPDPSLAGEAKPRDLFEGVSEEWIAEHDHEHGVWANRAKLERENYVTYTDAGYVVLVRVAEAMEQMNAFYRVFFRYGTKEHKGSVPRISVHVFRTRDEYLKQGSGPPVEWSGGQFTGSAVETYLTESGGFEDMTGTLFHEAAHQFVDLATNAAGWLNEGLASFFEGTRMLPNGSVVMNLPADGRLFPLAERMERGWMVDHEDGIDPKNPERYPDKAPRFGTVLENKYEWGPPWYAPTWGVVYFLYNYQDPVDGRFVYRKAFQEFVDKSGGRVGEGAVENFAEIVLAHPVPPIEGVEREGVPPAALPKTVAELDQVWKDWCLRLRDERQGKVEVRRPYKQWGRYAAKAGDYATAGEHYEKGLNETPDDTELLVEYARLLAERFENPDRATRLVLEAIHLMEQADAPDAKAIADAEKLLTKLDPKYETLAKAEEEIAASARAIVQRYQGAGLQMMVMDTSWRLGLDLGLSDLFLVYEDALRKSGKSLAVWELAYDEHGLEGWNAAANDGTFRADGTFLVADFGKYDPAAYDFRMLTLDEITSGDFSMEAEVEAEKGTVGFCGFVFGQKGAQSFHGLVLFPGKTGGDGTADTGYVDLLSSFGAGEMKTWRHVPVATAADPQATSAGSWHDLRVDVSGRFADLWYDGTLIASHEFSSTEVLLGRFGLITSPGHARFRNVRYLARDRRDPGARIERAVKVESLRATGEAIGGSYQGLVPPWPKVSAWVQGERAGWDEKGRVPQLLVFFSIEQNELIPLDPWLADIAKRTSDIGLEFVCIASPNDKDKLADYVKEHPFPGAVGVDVREGVGIGDTFDKYFIRRFNLPRLLLLDLDQTVVWEGDPGFEAGVGWDPAVGSFLDDPLEELVQKRKLRALQAWRKSWTEIALPAMSQGDVAKALPVLSASPEFDRRYAPEAGVAQARLAALRSAVEALSASGAALQRESAEPAFDVLISWAPALGREVSKKELKDLKGVLESPAAKDWAKVPQHVERYAQMKKDAAEKEAFLLEKLGALQGRFATELVAELRAASEKGDHAAFDALVAGAPSRPRLWLAQTFFGW